MRSIPRSANRASGMDVRVVGMKFRNGLGDDERPTYKQAMPRRRFLRAHSQDDVEAFESYENIDILAEDTILSQSLSEKVLLKMGMTAEE